MDRISTLNRALNLFGLGKHGFKNRNIGLGVEPTEFSAEWCNGVQEELLALIEGGGVAPDANQRNQIVQALRGVGIFLTQGQFDSTDKVATTAFVHRAIGGYQAFFAYNTPGNVIPAAQANSIIELTGFASSIILPSLASVRVGSTFLFVGSIVCTIARQGADVIFSDSTGAVTSIRIADGGSTLLIAGADRWYRVTSNSLGVLQSWGVQPRFLSTTYTNTRAHAIALSVYWSSTAIVQALVYVDGVVADNAANNVAGQFSTSRAIVPSRSTYRVEVPGGTIGQWLELT